MEHKLTAKPAKSGDTSNAAQQMFTATLLNLSWQLLIVVLAPFLGGYWLDTHNKSKPLWTLIGLGVALILAALTTYQAYKSLTAKQSSLRGDND